MRFKADAGCNTRETYVKRGKNGAADAEAICEAVTGAEPCASMGVKTIRSSSVMMLHRVRPLILMRQRAHPGSLLPYAPLGSGSALPFSPIGREGLDRLLLTIVADHG